MRLSAALMSPLSCGSSRLTAMATPSPKYLGSPNAPPLNSQHALEAVPLSQKARLIPSSNSRSVAPLISASRASSGVSKARIELSRKKVRR